MKIVWSQFKKSRRKRPLLYTIGIDFISYLSHGILEGRRLWLNLIDGIGITEAEYCNMTLIVTVYTLNKLLEIH